MTLKWPNDVLLLEGRKVSPASCWKAGGTDALAIGIGINLAHYPAGYGISRHLALGPQPGWFCAATSCWRHASRAAGRAWYEVWRLNGLRRAQGFALAARGLRGEAGAARTSGGGRMAKMEGVFEDLDRGRRAAVAQPESAARKPASPPATSSSPSEPCCSPSTLETPTSSSRSARAAPSAPNGAPPPRRQPHRR